MPRPIVALTAPTLLLVACLAACAPDPELQPAGEGLVILPYDGPLARGVEALDPRPYFHDFGIVPDGETVVRVFRMRNADPRPVAIKSVVPGCGCTVASLRVVHADGTVEHGESIRSKAETLLSIPPGEIGELEVRVETAHLVVKNNHKLITIRVLTDSPNGYFLNFEVHVFVEKPFAIVPDTLAFGNVPENGGMAAKVEIVPAGDRSLELDSVLELPAGMQAELVEEIRNLAPVWVLSARLEPPLARGGLKGTLRLATRAISGDAGPPLDVPFTATVVGDLQSDPQRIVFRALPDLPTSGSAEVFSLLSGHQLRVTDVELPAEHRAALAVSFEPVAADDAGRSKRWKVTLTLQEPRPAEQVLSGTSIVHLDDPQHPTYELGYAVHLR